MAIPRAASETVTAGQWLVSPEDANATIPAALNPTGPILWHDSREITQGQIYLALTGENFDGHDFIPQAFTQGAALAIVDSEAAASGQRFEHHAHVSAPVSLDFFGPSRKSCRAPRSSPPRRRRPLGLGCRSR